MGMPVLMLSTYDNPTYVARAVTLPQSSREARIEFVTSLTSQQLRAPYPPQFAIFAKGEGSILTDVRGREYIDGLSCLWNVAVGHGRQELADAAAQQMGMLAFANGYSGYSNVPAIELAERICDLSYSNMDAVFFANSGSEANEVAFKLARFYWYLKGNMEKVKIFGRRQAYHGGTLATTAATGLPQFTQELSSSFTASSSSISLHVSVVQA